LVLFTEEFALDSQNHNQIHKYTVWLNCKAL
jgi:hypothetical protein